MEEGEKKKDSMERKNKTEGMNLKEGHGDGAVVSKLLVLLTDASETLSLTTDEAYSIRLYTSSIHLIAQNVYGALRGLETLSQYVTFDYERTRYVLPNFPLLIEDSPAFPHRGLSFDTARHFFPLPFIFHLLDAMSFSKLNVLHWHMVDGQSFPLISPSHPSLSKGAFSSSERYTLRHIRSVVRYAKDRGIRVIVELDTPSHCTSWGIGMPSLLPANFTIACPEQADCVSKADAKCNVPLDPSNKDVISIIEDIWRDLLFGTNERTEKENISREDEDNKEEEDNEEEEGREGEGEVMGVVEDEFIHMGGDEPHVECWQMSSDIRHFMAKHKLSTMEELLSDFLLRINRIAERLRKTAIVWEEAYSHNPSAFSPSTVVNLWRIPSTPTLLSDLTRSGTRVIVNTMMYLDWQDLAWRDIFHLNWLKSSTPLTKEQMSFILGGEVSVWSERIDPSTMDMQVWPRAAVAADLFWRNGANAQNVTENDAQIMLEELRCVLLRRGIAASPLRASKESPKVVAPGSCSRSFGEKNEMNHDVIYGDPRCPFLENDPLHLESITELESSSSVPPLSTPTPSPSTHTHSVTPSVTSTNSLSAPTHSSSPVTDGSDVTSVSDELDHNSSVAISVLVNSAMAIFFLVTLAGFWVLCRKRARVLFL